MEAPETPSAEPTPAPVSAPAPVPAPIPVQPPAPAPACPAAQTVTAPLTELVRIILSGLARITLERRFSCGKTLLAQVLCGSNSSRISELNLNTITTYGKLQCYKQKEVVPMIEALMNCGLIRQEKAGSGQFQVPVLALTDLGRDVMRGTRPLEVVPPFPRPLLTVLLPAERFPTGQLPTGQFPTA